MTIHDVLKLNITKLKEHNIEEPILKAKILLAFVLCKTKEYLLINQNEEINKDIIKIYETNIQNKIICTKTRKRSIKKGNIRPSKPSLN